MVLDNWLGRSVSLNKLLVVMLLAFAGISSHADDLIIADDFKSGDLVSADTFNQIFDTIEKVNRTIVDSDLVGVWSCNASEHSANTASGVSGWTQKGLLWELLGAQINMTATTGPTSRDSAYTISTSAPSPLYTTSSSASSGTYSLFEGMLFVNIADSTATHTYEADIVSSDRITLKGNAELGPPQPTFIVCDSAEVVPASPTAPTAMNNKTGINLAWTDSSSDETGFKVYRKLSTETEAKVIATQTAVTYSDTDLTEGQTAYYYVTAYNDNGDSAKSKTVSASLDNTAPTVISTIPENNGTGSRQLRNIVVTFSEKVEIVCPAGDQYSGPNTCPTSGYAITFTAMVEGNSRTVGNNNISVGFGGSTVLSTTTMGSAERFDANQTGITVTVDKDWIRDVNGVQLAEDVQFNFNVDDSLDNPSCPPSC